MKYKKGDKVKIKGLDWYYSNSDCMGKVNCGDFDFTTLQTSYCGKTLEISSVCDGFYIMKGVGHHWTDEMIEGIADVEPQEKMVSLDKARKVFQEMLVELCPELLGYGAMAVKWENEFRKRLEE